MAKSRRVDQKVHDLAKDLGYEVWVGSDNTFYAAVKADRSATVTGGDTARQALDHAYHNQNPDTESVCEVMLDNSDNVVPMAKPPKERAEKPEKPEKPPRQAKVAKPKPEPVNRALTGVQYHIREAWLLSEKKATWQEIQTTLAAKGLTSTEESINALLSGFKHSMLVEKNVLETGKMTEEKLLQLIKE